MWYRFASLQDELEKLRTQGIDESILALFSDPKYDFSTKGKMLGAIKQNPNITLHELENLSGQNKPSREEKFILDRFENEKFKNWLYHKLKGWRIQPQKPDGEYDHNIPMGGMDGEHANFLEQALHMQDFVNNIVEVDPDYNLGLKSWEELVEDTSQWEDTLHGSSAGKFYNPNDRKVVMNYTDGWSMVELISENDIYVEGEKMHNCLKNRNSDFWESVRSGIAKLFSLRTPANQPMVSIEVVGKKVMQIKGHNNAEVFDQDLVDKIKDFFDDREDIKKTNNDRTRSRQEIYYEDWQDRVDFTDDPEELGQNITYLIYGPDESEYDSFGDDDDDDSQDFNRFGIQSPTWNHQAFADDNLYRADIPDLMAIVVNEIKSGLAPEQFTYRIDSEKRTIEDYPIEDYVDTFYDALEHKALLSLKQNADRHDFEKYLDVNRVLETVNKKYEEAQEKYKEFRENYNSKEKIPSFMQWYEKQPEYMYFLLANKIENFFEKSKFASEYKKKTGNTYKLPSGYQKNSWDIDDIVPFLKTQPLLDILEKQKINDRSQLRLFAPQNETQEKDNQTIDVLTERPMTQKDENWAYAGVYNNKNYKKGN
jgi:hypothetical protein